MSDERIAILEQRLLRLETELAQARRHKQAVQTTSRRGSVARMFVALCAGGGLMLLLGQTPASSASPAAAGSTLKAPFKVVSGSGATILQVDGNSLTYYAGSGGTVSIESDNGAPAIYVHHGVNGPVVAALGDAAGRGGGNLQLFPDSGSTDTGVSVRAGATTGSVAVYAQGAQSILGAQAGSPMALVLRKRRWDLVSLPRAMTGFSRCAMARGSQV